MIFHEDQFKEKSRNNGELKKFRLRVGEGCSLCPYIYIYAKRGFKMLYPFIHGSINAQCTLRDDLR